MFEQRGEGVRFGLKLKFIILISLLSIIMGFILGWFSWSGTRDALEDALKKRGTSLAKGLAYNSIYGVLIGDTSALDRLAKGVKEEPDVDYLIIVDKDGKVLAHSDQSEVGKNYSDKLTKKALEITESGAEIARLVKEGLYDIAVPIGSSDTGTSGRIGAVRIGLSTEGMKQKLDSIRNVIFILTTITIGIGIIVSFFFIKVIINPIEKMVGVAVGIADGDFMQSVKIASQDEIGILGGAFTRMSANLRGMIMKIREVSISVTSASDQISKLGDKVAVGAENQAASAEKSSASVEEMKGAIKDVAENADALFSSAEATTSSILEMDASIREVANSSVGLASSVDDTSSSIMEMSASIKQVAENVDVLSAASEETASAANEINASVREVESNARESARLSEKVSSDAQELGVKSIEKTIAGMKKIKDTVEKSATVINRLGERSEHAGKILTVIDEVTKQTNLLALNAAILAAQAGEHGKGFAVVADEIKNLAERTASSTKEIAELIENVQLEAKDAVGSIKDGARSVEEGVRLSLEAGEALKEILMSSRKSSEMGREIEMATVEQAKGIKQVTDSIQKISGMVKQISLATTEQIKGSRQIMQATERMRDITRDVKNSTEEQAKGSKQITKAVENVTERAQQIVKAIDAQKKGSEVVVRFIDEMRGISKESVILVSEMNLAVDTLTKQAILLKDEMGKFKV
ncbi:MAG: methyl-accepting chemotaxis protein [Nitrospirota bacterium]